MIKNLPEGTSIGEMRASMQWILSHTARFAGLIDVTIQEGRGFILINKGKPLFFYFRQGNNELKGHTAFEYFNSQPFIQFDLRKYTALEMTTAIGLISSTEGEEKQNSPGKKITRLDINEAGPPDSIPADKAVTTNDDYLDSPGNSEEVPSVYEMDSDEYSEFVKKTVPFLGLSINRSNDTLHDPSLFPHVPIRGSETGREPPKKTELGELILGQIPHIPGVLAVTIFRRGLNVLSVGDINYENLVEVAEDLTESAKGLSTVMRTGPFIQVTLQIPAGNIIITPYYDEYIFILTSPEINLGQIRKIIRELPGILPDEETGETI